jgi:hypothetical protein
MDKGRAEEEATRAGRDETEQGIGGKQRRMQGRRRGGEGGGEGNLYPIQFLQHFDLGLHMLSSHEICPHLGGGVEHLNTFKLNVNRMGEEEGEGGRRRGGRATMEQGYWRSELVGVCVVVDHFG